jgi:hypothetical protein
MVRRRKDRPSRRGHWICPSSAFGRYPPGSAPPIEELSPGDWELIEALIEVMYQAGPPRRGDRLH